MTNRASFVLHGRERICIGQLALAPGIYFEYDSRFRSYSARVIPRHGVHVRCELSRERGARVFLGHGRPMDATLLLRALGWTGTAEGDGLPAKSGADVPQAQAIRTVGRSLAADPGVPPETAFALALQDELGYTLGELGRKRMNERLGTAGTSLHLEPEDLVAVFHKLAALGEREDEIDDLDHMKNLVVRMVGESLLDHMTPACQQARHDLAAWLCSDMPDDEQQDNESEAGAAGLQAILGRRIQDALDDFFLRCSLVRDLDTTNQLAAVAQARQVTRSGPGGLDKKRTGLLARYVHPSTYGRFCAIDTPEGDNIGLLRSLAMYAKLDPRGFVLVPYLRVQAGHVTDEVVYLSPSQEDEHVLAAGDTPRDDDGKLIGDKLFARKGYDYREVTAEQVEFVGVSAHEILGAPGHTIPLIEFDDPNRSLMGANMSRQAVPVLGAQEPVVATGYESRLAATEPCQAHDACTASPEIAAPGRNLLAAYVPWEGYNYEDGIVVSERVVREQALTSIHIREFTIETYQSAEGKECFTCDLPTSAAEACLHLDSRGIVRVGEEVRYGDVLVGKVKQNPDGDAHDASLRMPRGSEGRVIEAEYQARRLGFALPTGVEERVRVVVAVKRGLKVGDKLANRHGAKGVVGLIVPEEDMPCLADGTPVDLALNPLGVPSRMNIGQLMEAHLSLAGRALGLQIISPPLNGATHEDARALLREAGLPDDGRLQLYDGRTGKPFDQRSTVGFVYYRKLEHMADDAFQARATGAYVPATQQPVRGRQRQGGQKVGKMEIWALQSHGAVHNLREFLSIKADDAIGRRRIYDAIVNGREQEAFQAPESANLLLRELRSAGLDVRYMARGTAVDVDEPYDINQVDEVRIGFASGDVVRGWSNGEVVSEASCDDETGEPVAGGLFCQRIFGPLRPFQCACGKLRGEERSGEVCEDCGAEVLDSHARFRRMGHIELAAPVIHPWLLKVEPNPLCALLGMDKAEIGDIIYCRKHVVLDPKDTAMTQGQSLDDGEYRQAREKFGYQFQAGMGADAVAQLLASCDVEKAKRSLLARATPDTRVEVAEALTLLNALGQGAGSCRRGVLEAIPVLPAGLRPAVRLGRSQTATSDLNELYERVIKRNNRLKALLAMKTPDIMLRDEQRLLQEAVDALFGNGYRGRSMRGSHEVTLLSLSDRLKGVRGRFIQGLAGKRTDYSARAVIAPGARLKLDQCGLPSEIALEVFRPFVVAELLRTHTARSSVVAERMVERQRHEALRALEAVVRDKVVLLVRAPALHKYSVLAFRPVLTNERAIRIHPNVNIGFNADFDGDQMTIHVPLSKAAHEEAERLLMPRQNMFGIASGSMMNRPSQDIVLGCYYLTSERPGAKGEGASFESALAAKNAWKAGRVSAHAKVGVHLGGEAIVTTVGRLLFNDILPEALRLVNEPVGLKQLREISAACYAECGLDRTAELMDAVKEFGFHHATLSGMSVWRMEPYGGLDRILAETDAQVAALCAKQRAGEMDEQERYLHTIDLWSAAQSRVREGITEDLNARDDGFLPVAMMVRSGARGSLQQMFMLFGMRGLHADMFGHIVEYPVRQCMLTGIGQMHYFLTSTGARAGLAMTAIRTSPAGDLMRRIVEALEDVVVVEADCGTRRGIEMAAPARGRVAAADVLTAAGERIVCAGEEVSGAALDRLAKAGVEKVTVRSPLTCESRGGICAKCYGHDVGQGRLVEVGSPVGITAALSLGEPLAQLTMRSFHLGHRYPFSKIARGKPEQDIKYSSGFPRLEEVFMMLEKRRAHGPGLDGVDERPDPHTVLEQQGETPARQYLVAELDRVYSEAGVCIDSKHYEIAVRQLMSYVEVGEPGDTRLIVGQRVRRDELAEVNAEAARSGREPASATPLLLPITEVALRTDSFLAASASWETVSVLTRAALREDVDRLRGMRENIILGRLIPAGSEWARK